MIVKAPIIKSPVGAGDIVGAVVSALTGIAPCAPCMMRKSWLNKAITFVPKKGTT